MSNADAIELHDKINNTVSNGMAKVYNSTSDDKEQENDIKNIMNSWGQADSVIRTPTIEAGVSFDKEHFDRIYGVISENSCTQTACFPNDGTRQKSQRINCQNIELCKLQNQQGISMDIRGCKRRIVIYIRT